MSLPLQKKRLATLLVLLSSGITPPAVDALQTDTRVSDYPFDDPARFSTLQDNLPDLGVRDSSSNDAFAKKIASVAKEIGEASMDDTTDTSVGRQAGEWAFNHFRDELADEVATRGHSLLSPWGNASLTLQLDMEGSLAGSSAQLLTPWQDKYNYLTFSQLGVVQNEDGTVGNAGLGQRWFAGNWQLGYNGFVDRQFNSGLQRAGVGTEAWGDFLRFSANYYHPLGGWRNHSSTSQQRLARGYDITTQGYLPFYRQLGVSLTYEQYLGDNVDLFNSGNSYRNPVAVKVGVSYTPVPLLSFTAAHKEGEGGESQDQFGLKINYRPGVALSKQLSASNVAQAHSLRGSRYDAVERNSTPVLEFRQRRTLSVFLATPPWQLQPGETLPLKLQIHAANAIKQLSWQGDTQALSLTPPANNRDANGWTIIMPAWDSAPDASNEYRLSVTLEDSKQQRVTSNWITLKLSPPMLLQNSATESYDLMAQ